MKREATLIMIQPLTSADLDEVGPIEDASHKVPWTRKMFEEELNGNPFSNFYAIRDPADQKLLAYVCFWLVFEEIRFMNLSVSPNHRRQGLGEKLVRWVLEWGWGRGAYLATLEVRASNKAARRLYEKLAFVVAGTRSGYYGEPKEDALIMSLNRTAWKGGLNKQGGGRHGGKIFRGPGEASSEQQKISRLRKRASKASGRIKQADSA